MVYRWPTVVYVPHNLYSHLFRTNASACAILRYILQTTMPEMCPCMHFNVKWEYREHGWWVLMPFIVYMILISYIELLSVYRLSCKILLAVIVLAPVSYSSYHTFICSDDMMVYGWVFE